MLKGRCSLAVKLSVTLTDFHKAVTWPDLLVKVKDCLGHDGKDVHTSERL